MINIHTLLLNAFIVLISIFLYQVLCLDREKEKYKSFISLFLFSATNLLCMTFPIHIYSGFFFDLRFIPVILCFFYSGYRNLVIITAVHLLYRYLLGGGGFYASIEVACILMLGLMIAGPFRDSFPIRKKMAIATFFTLFYSIIVSISSMATLGQSEIYVRFFLEYIAINLITIWMSVYLLENLIEKSRLKKEIRQAEKLSLFGNLTASIAHEIRNPLTVVNGFLQLLIENRGTEQQNREYQQLMKQELERALSIITQYLSIAKPDPDITEPLELGKVIAQVTRTMSPYANLNKVEIHSLIPPGLHLVADLAKIKQCFINIMKNGIEAMEDGGVLQINAEKRKNELVIDITDQGVGMTQEEIDRLGMPFYSTKEKGTGLGTMYSYSILRGMGGRVEVKSKKGAGTRVTLIIPVPQESPVE
ncbi:ATP-binding protein [Paenibacillus residui]|uniref:histidine kinase n=1 Tax=Paenibacillus residui TaxID=629724 RepID=A0ABW3D7G7_9BACL